MSVSLVREALVLVSELQLDLVVSVLAMPDAAGMRALPGDRAAPLPSRRMRTPRTAGVL